jgi:hypothetical protein
MILIHKPQHLPTMLSSTHRRHPSAPPAVLVQPTHTPGLLSLSKPIRPSPRHQQPRTRFSPKPKPATARKLSLQPIQSSTAPTSPVIAAQEKDNVQLVPTTPTPEKTLRGRLQAKDKTGRRSSSHSHHPRRQPSPPQAEAAPHPTTRNTKRKSLPINPRPKHSASTNAFDPFLDSDSDRPSAPALNPLLSTPTLAPPSGTLAKRRGHVQGSPTPAPAKAVTQSSLTHLRVKSSKAVAVPFPKSNHRTDSSTILSRSDPISSHMRQRSDAFPICDDTTEYGGDDTPPHTPVRGETSIRRAFEFDDGPRTAPLSRTSRFPFRTPSPTPVRRHRRAPSEGVFHMSSDEDSTSDMTEMLTLLKKGKGMDKAPLFASSLFQNSPSPDELPPPSFGATRL